MTRLNSTQSTIITLYDAITDSPVYRASTLQFDKQLELFTVWVKNLAKETKSYAEKLKELNELTLSLTSKLDLTMYHYLLGSEMTFTAASSFTDALKTNLIFKTKMVKKTRKTGMDSGMKWRIIILTH
ncbi:uncharacterized protein BX664DRAFT_197658 [Halteromyces radiatus]|uniref:uncharacterized protein n=1 Tax=Halteromyces radiatus TaxID=101107 RepID=UPI00221E8419|nr:uncharacterized protein BX664DRAFT_197658 [Halteromyces radiatus]KAI8081630.1 hypothetical protein BX664DRAFT_197658 [Halteromyces radiatus]